MYETWKNVLNLSVLQFSHLWQTTDKIASIKLVCKYQLFGIHTIYQEFQMIQNHISRFCISFAFQWAFGRLFCQKSFLFKTFKNQLHNLDFNFQVNSELCKGVSFGNRLDIQSSLHSLQGCLA